MKTKIWVLGVILSVVAIPSSACADLVLVINNLTANEFSFSISGSFSQDVAGDQKQWLAVMPDYTNNVGVNVDWIDNSLGGITLLPGGFTVVTNTIAFNGSPASSSYYTANASQWGDSFYFNAGFNITAGTTVSGTLTVQANNAFNPATTNFQLASGFNDALLTWNQWEANAIPEPTSCAAFLAISASLLVRRRRA